MSDSAYFELPKPSEKLAFKFIIESVKKKNKEQNEPILEAALPESTEEINDPQLSIPDERCGRLETEPDPIEIQNEISFAELEPGKKYFRIGETSEIIGVEAYVLRYWENEFPSIRPIKASSGHRVYSRKDVEYFQMIKHLLYIEKFSIKGAKKKLLEKKKEVKIVHADNSLKFKEMANEIKELIQLIRAL